MTRSSVLSGRLLASTPLILAEDPLYYGRITLVRCGGPLDLGFHRRRDVASGLPRPAGPRPQRPRPLLCAVRRAVYDADTGVEKPFVSGYSNAFIPNVRDWSADVRAAIVQG